MKKIDLRKQFREVKFITEHSLTADQFNKLVQDKINRARVELERRTSSKQLHV